MEKLTFYEQVGILIPGALFLSVLLVIVPGADVYLSTKDISIGTFGVFLIVAYASGHAIAAVGNLLETMWWKLWGGMPTDWVIYRRDWVLNHLQKEALHKAVNAAFGHSINKVEGLQGKEWRPIGRQVYRYALSLNASRIETFNGNYGLNRGLAAALLTLAIVNLFLHSKPPVLSAALLVGGLVFGYRAHRFGVHFAREVYLVFLNAKAPVPAPTAVAKGP